jgi:hypothetical protein
MADYGLRVKDADGNTILDTSEWIIRTRYYTVASGGSNGNVTLSDIDGHTTHLISIPLEGSKLAHSISRSETTISWTAQTSGSGGLSFGSSDSLILILLVD